MAAVLALYRVWSRLSRNTRRWIAVLALFAGAFPSVALGAVCSPQTPSGTCSNSAEICHNGVCQLTACGRLGTWLDAYVEPWYVALYPFTLAAGQGIPQSAGYKSVCTSSDARFGYAVTADGSLVHWGYEPQIGSIGTVLSDPNNDAVHDAVQVACLTNAVAVLHADGTVTGWGRAGDPKWESYIVASPPAGMTNVAALAAGGMSGAALKADGTIQMWGWDEFGTYGVLNGQSGFKAIAGGSSNGGGNFIAIKTDGSVVLAAKDFDENGSPVDFAAPPAGMPSVIAVAIGRSQALAVGQDGAVYAWGSKAEAPPSDLKPVKQVAVFSATYSGQSGYSPLTSLFALQVDGTVRAWGGINPGGLTKVASLTGVNTLESHGGLALSCVGTCGAISPAGCCDGNNVHTCNALGQPSVSACANGSCGWDPGAQLYKCSTDGAPAPGSSPLQSCVCVPNCTNPDGSAKQCGGDGCGGTCGNGTCDDGDPCTVNDTCSGAACVAGLPFNCEDGNACTQDACAVATSYVTQSTCVKAPDGQLAKLTCPAGSTIAAISYAKHGELSGTCPDPGAGAGACVSADLKSWAELTCLGQNSCSLDAATIPPVLLPVTSGLAAHYDATVAASVTVDANGVVSAWLDLSGNSRDLAVSGQAPVYSTSLINGFAGINFDATDRRMVTAAFPITTSVTVFAVVQYRSPDPFGAIFHHGSRDNDWSLEQHGEKSADVTHFQSANDNDGDELSLANGTNYILSGRLDGDTRTYTSTTTGATLASASGSGNTVSPGDKVLYVGSSEVSEDSRAYIGELLYYDHALSDSDRTAVLDWLRAKWKLDTPTTCTGATQSLGVVATCTPTNSSALCAATVNENDLLTLSCPAGQAIVDIPFASYGQPVGTCPTVQPGQCDAPGALDIVKTACLGKGSCSVVGGNSVFGDPCGGVYKRLAVRAVCGPVSASCNHEPALGALCSDGSACTSGDFCQGSACVGGNLADCDDGNVCTADSCDPLAGCKYAASTGACSDGDVCTTGDTCLTSKCQPGTGAPNCDDGNPCSTDTCDSAAGCQHANAAAGTACDDGSDCTNNDVCTSGVCKGTGTVNCDDGNPCTRDDCLDANTCAPHTALADGKACTDGNLCHVGATCASASCQGWSLQACDDGNPCTDDSCNAATGCAAKPNSGGCSDNNACTTQDGCSGGACVGATVVECDDKNACTTDSCDAKLGCQHVNADGKTCDDGNLCTQTDVCTTGACAGSNPKNCSDGLSCTLDTCNAVLGCQHANSTEPCDDGDACTKGDACWQGTCIGGAKPACNDGNACTTDSCDAKLGCVFSANTNPCSDGSACTVGDVCAGGSCKPGAALACDDKNGCTADSCAPSTGCVHVNATAACDDGKTCTVNDVCAKGSCAGVAKNCDDKNACSDDVCDVTKGCVSTPNAAPCDDGNPCTLKDACKAGKCASGSPNPCDDGNPCTEDYCEKKWAPYCFHDVEPKNYLACDDKSTCTTNDQCLGGNCTGGSYCQNASCALVSGQPACVCPAGQTQVASGSKSQPLKCCVPQCTGKTCGDDGCGGTCGTCTSEESCTAVNLTWSTQYYCAPKVACYGKVPTSFGCCDGKKLMTCNAPNSIATTDCAASGRYCGWDAGWGQYTCTADGATEASGAHPFKCPKAGVCTPDCTGKNCGPDGCGGTCGSCGTGQVCSLSKGKCFTPCDGAYPISGCVAQAPGDLDVVTYCPGIEAKATDATQVVCAAGQKAGWKTSEGRFVCGGTDTLPAGKSATCPKICSCGSGALTKTCGDNGCGTSCGTCPNGASCSTVGSSAGTCASCPSGQVATTQGACCTPSCKGCTYTNKKTGKCYAGYEYTKTCGDDGCGGSCGTCSGVGQGCTTAGTCAVATCTAAGVKSDGTCTGSALQYCTATELVSQDCATAGGTCKSSPFTGIRTCSVATTAHECAVNACNQNAAWSCQCDAACAGRGDCCDNFGTTCGVSLATGSCGDKNCSALAGEDCLTCSQDCGACPAKTNASLLDPPYPRVVTRDGGVPSAQYGIRPVDDVRPSAPPIPIRGLVAHMPGTGALAGDPDARARIDILKTGGTLGSVTDGVGGSGAISTRNGAVSSFAAVRLFSDRTIPGEASVGTGSNGGFTVAGWVRLPTANADIAQALGSAQAVSWPGRALYQQLYTQYTVSRPKDSGVKLACANSDTKNMPIRISAVQAYYGEAIGPAFQPLDGYTPTVTEASFRALTKTYACSYPDVQAIAETACLGKTDCTVDPWLAAADPCAGVSGAQGPARLMVRYICDAAVSYGPQNPVLNLSVEPSSQGGKLRLDVVGEATLRSQSAMPTGAWTHVALTFAPNHPTASGDTQSGRMVLAIDGAVVATSDLMRIAPLVDWTWGAAKLGNIPATHPGACNGCGNGEASFDVASFADFDDLMLYQRALDAAELKALVGKPNLGIARVWPSVEAKSLVHDGLWTTGGKPTLVPVTVPQVRDPVASVKNKDVALRADFDGIAVPKGAVLSLPAEGEDLTGLAKWTFAAWIRAGTVTAGTTLLEMKQGATSRLKLASATACNGRALEVTFPDGTKLAQTNCDHVLGDGAWQFVTVTQLQSGRRLELDGAVATGTGASQLFSSALTGARALVVTSAADLGWASLTDRPLTRDESQMLRAQGPVTWLSGAVVAAIGGTTPLDWSAFSNFASGTKADAVTVVSSNGSAVKASDNFSASSLGLYRLLVPAKGKLAALDDGAMRHVTVVETIILPALTKTGDKAQYLPFQAVAGGKLGVEALLDCVYAAPKTGTASSQTCKLIVTRKTKTATETAVSAPFVLSFNDGEARVRLAVAVGDTLAASLGYRGKTATSAIVYSDSAGSHTGAGVTNLPLTAWSPQAVSATVTVPPGDAFYIPGVLAATSYSGAAPATLLKGVYDVRLYPRALGTGERSATVQSGCASSPCEVDNRVCVETPASGNQLTAAACGGCKSGFHETNGTCAPLTQQGQLCVDDSVCTTGQCSRQVVAWEKDANGSFSIPNYSTDAWCTYKTPTAACGKECLKLGKACGSMGPSDEPGYGCQASCIPDFTPGKATGTYVGYCNGFSCSADKNFTCLWQPPATFNDHCVNNEDCDAGVCVDRTTKVYGVTTDAGTLTHGRNYSAGQTDAYWDGPYSECADKAGCAVPNEASGTDKVCVAATQAQCTAVNMQSRSVTGEKWDGTTVSAYVCEACSAEMYSGKPLYHQAWSVMSPAACKTLYDNYFDLLTTKNGALGVYVGNTFYTKGAISPHGDILDQEPSLAILRRLILKDADPTSTLQPETISNLQKAGIGNDLIGWETLPEANKQAYRRKYVGSCGWQSGSAQCGHVDVFPIGACNTASYKFASMDYLLSYATVSDGGKTAYAGNSATYASAYFDSNLNKPVCVPSKYPNGTKCPPPGKETDPQFSRDQAGKMCDSGFCAADNHVCDTGFKVYESIYGQGRNDGESGGGGNDLGAIALNQDQGALFRLQKADGLTIPLEAGTTDRRTFLMEGHSKESISLFGKTLNVLDMSVSMSATPGAAVSKKRASFKQEFLILGVQPPSLPKLPKMSCGGSSWENGEYSGAGCSLVRQSVGIGVEKKSKGQTGEGEHGTAGSKSSAQFGGTGTADAGGSLANIVDASSVQLASFKIPLPLSECPSTLDGFKIVTGRACFAKQTTIGPVPFKVEAQLSPEASVGFGAELDKDTLEPAAVVTPAVGLAVEIKGGIGGSVGPLEIFAGIKAAITIIELAFPVKFAIGFKQAMDVATNAPVTDMWVVQKLIKNDIEVTFLKLALGLFFDVGIGPFTVSFEYEFFEYEGIRLVWALAEGFASQSKVDFQWALPTTSVK